MPALGFALEGVRFHHLVQAIILRGSLHGPSTTEDEPFDVIDAEVRDHVFPRPSLEHGTHSAFFRIAASRSATVRSSPSCRVSTEIRMPLSPVAATLPMRIGGSP